MLEYTGANPAADPTPWRTFFRTTVVLRVGAGVVLLAHHGWRGAWDSYEFLWKEQPWDWVPHFAQAGIPYAHLTAPAVAIVVASVAMSWTAGFLTRLFSALFIPILITFIVIAQDAGSIHAELGWLYLIIAITLLLFGSGSLSLDKLFHLGERWRSPTKRRKKRW